MLGYLCVLLKAAVLLLSWDVRLPLCIVDGQSCSNTALVGCLPLCIVDSQSFLYCLLSKL